MPSTPIDARKLVPLEEYSLITGISIPTLRRWIRKGKIRSYQPGGKNGKIYLPLDAIESSASPPPSSELSKPRAGRSPKWMS